MFVTSFTSLVKRSLYFKVTFCDLTLTLTPLSMPFIPKQYPSWTQHFGSPSTLGERELFAVRLADPRTQNVKTLYCDL